MPCEREKSRMIILKSGVFKAPVVLIALGMLIASLGCSQSLPDGAVGNIGRYNYSPSVIQTGNVRQFWWCGQGVNPNKTSQDTDAIFYESINLSTNMTYGPVLVLAETPGAWDSVYTCNPKVIGGSFENPLGDGQNYSYAMYYVATASQGGNNSIGVAFSNDGIAWKKYSQPIILSTVQNGYGVGQPALYNSDHKAAITMYYEDSYPTLHHVAATSTDGLHFHIQGTLTPNGLDPDNPGAVWGDMAYDSKTAEWYAVFNRPFRPPSTTGNIPEYGQYGIELYMIPQGALLTGSTPWQQLATFDTNATGYESNFIAGFVRDSFGNLNVGSYPTIQMYTSVSYPQPSWDASPAEAGSSAKMNHWILTPLQWVPNGDELLPLNRYFNKSVHEVTTGPVSPDAGFQLEELLGHLYAGPSHGADLPFYACKGGRSDYFVSLDINCEAQRALGKNGYGFSQPVAGLNLVALYRCSSAHDHFASKDPKCEGQTTDKLLGYVAP
jgi:hypothetical protein